VADANTGDSAPSIIAAGNNGLNRKRDNTPEEASDSSSESPTESSSQSSHSSSSTNISSTKTSSSGADMGAELGDLDSEANDIDAERESYYDSLNAVPTSELTQQEVEDAQKYGGYTGGLVGKLCDTYVNSLKSRIPLYLTLVGVWVVIAIFGLVHVARDYSKISKMEMR
ncbi:hypothetical protein EV175_001112, partial [Coemansia sp. RSA 1933]